MPVNRLTIKSPKDFIKDLPDDMGVVVERHSDYALLESYEIALIEAVPDENPLVEWVTSSHPTMSQEHKAREKTYLKIGGA